MYDYRPPGILIMDDSSCQALFNRWLRGEREAVVWLERRSPEDDE